DRLLRRADVETDHVRADLREDPEVAGVGGGRKGGERAESAQRDEQRGFPRLLDLVNEVGRVAAVGVDAEADARMDRMQVLLELDRDAHQDAILLRLASVDLNWI